MSAQDSAPRKLFDVELPARVARLLATVEARAKQPVEERKGKKDDVAPLAGFFEEGKPVISAVGRPSVEGLALEVARLWLRDGATEADLPYAEMRHPGNQRLCKRLYRVLEQEIIASECETLGVGVRAWLKKQHADDFLGPIQGGRYRSGEPDPARLRDGALDALGTAINEVDADAARRLCMLVSEHDPAIGRSMSLMYRVVEQHRPFDGRDRIEGAYYLAVPFLFDARKAPAPER